MMNTHLPSRGLGDTVAKITTWFGIEPCGGCERRRETLNRWVSYGSPRSASAMEIPDKGIVVPSLPGLVTPAGGGFRELPPILASSGGWRAPDRRSGPLDWEGNRRERRSTGSNPGAASGGSATPTSFACGIDVTEMTKAAINSARSEFAKLTDDKKQEACGALSSLSTGAYAWDIIDLHRQVTHDTLNKPFRPACATSGATPACGSSVTVAGGCHFAGSANYVIFGVMCQLCHAYYQDMLNRASWYEIFDKDTFRACQAQFSKSGMLGLIDLYKKYIPLVKFDAPASNLEAAKRWSIAGYDGWPTTAATPRPDRANCELTCTTRALFPFQVSWYPFLNPYSR